MVRSRALMAAGAVALGAAMVLLPVYAHEGHNQPTGSATDPNAPKRVSEATALAIGLQTAEVDFGRVEDVVRIIGMVQARPDAVFTVAPRYAGIVRSISVQPGDRVTRGMVVAELDSPEIARLMYDIKRLEAENERLLADVTRAKSQVASLEIEVPALIQGAELAETEVQRLTAAGESVSANLLTQRRTEALRLRADAGLRGVALAQARAEVESLQRQAETVQASAGALAGTLPGAGGGPEPESLKDPARPGLLRYTSLIDGLVISRNAVPGQGVNAGATIVTVADFTSVQIQGELPEGLIDRIGSAQMAKVRIRRGEGANSDVIAEGTVRFISPVIDATKRTAHLIVDAGNSSGALRQGQFVDLAVVLSASEDAVVVPASAIVKEGPLQYVFVREGEGADEVFVKRDIATGVRDDRQVEIKQGLVPGDVIAVSGAFSLSQLRGFTPGAPEPEAAEPAASGHNADGHTH